jgi:hypothetical protein
VTVRYPEIEVRLVGQDGNAFNLIGLVARALTKAKVPAEEIKEFKTEAMSGDYNNLLVTCMNWVTVS